MALDNKQSKAPPERKPGDSRISGALIRLEKQTMKTLTQGAVTALDGYSKLCLDSLRAAINVYGDCRSIQLDKFTRDRLAKRGLSYNDIVRAVSAGVTLGIFTTRSYDGSPVVELVAVEREVCAA
jgi:hypothetical protein